MIEKWSKIIENEDYFTYEQFQALIDELLKMKNLFEKKLILEYILDIFIRIGYDNKNKKNFSR